jgi:transposase
MARKKTSMYKSREVLRLVLQCDLSNRRAARSCQVSPTTVSNIVSAAEQAGLDWTVVNTLSDQQLEERLTKDPASAAVPLHALPKFAELALELKRKGVTRRLLWEEYIAEHPDSYSYSQFCELFRRHLECRDPTMRFEHKFGEKLFVDWAGPTMAYFDEDANEMSQAYLFVAVLGGSDYSFVQAYADMKLPNWLRAHIEAFQFFGGVAELIVPDNPKTAVVRPCYYEPKLNRSYEELATHYGTAVLPARIRKPRDKAKAENGVLIAERRILAVLRNERFDSLGALREAVRTTLKTVNDASFSKMEGSRTELFKHEQPTLKALPRAPFELGIWGKAKVANDYHVQIEYHFYSVPYSYMGREVETRRGSGTVEIFDDTVRIASHKRSSVRGKATTDNTHRPPQHNGMIDLSMEKLEQRAAQVGTHCRAAVRTVMDSFPHPEMGFRSCQGIIRLARRFGRERLERACEHALSKKVCSYQTLKNMLENHREQPCAEPQPSVQHGNIRGADYYAPGSQNAEADNA